MEYNVIINVHLFTNIYFFEDITPCFQNDSFNIELTLSPEGRWLGFTLNSVLDLSIDFNNDDRLDIFMSVDKLVIEHGTLINDVYKSFVHSYPEYPSNIFNGSELCIPYDVEIHNLIGIMIYQSEGTNRREITKEKFADIIKLVNGPSTLSQKLLDESRRFLETGFHDMATLNAYMAFEVFIENFYKNIQVINNRDDLYHDFHTKGSKAIQTKNPTIHKLLNDGLYLLYKRTLEEEMYDIIDDLIDDVEDAMQWMLALNSPIKHFEIVNIKRSIAGIGNDENLVVLEIRMIEDTFSYFVLKVDKRIGGWFAFNQLIGTGKQISDEWFS
ncbi:MAG: hypothetical protein U9N81_04290 [Bacillota bacterium]|nr:hypothetical protein [Bacillota bacterium]MEA1960500.1 hypothetical protein [Bacillota bacterium]